MELFLAAAIVEYLGQSQIVKVKGIFSHFRKLIHACSFLNLLSRLR